MSLRGPGDAMTAQERDKVLQVTVLVSWLTFVLVMMLFSFASCGLRVRIDGQEHVFQFGGVQK
jgi:hypothetical protein